MTDINYFIVKHAENDYRLHQSDGTEISTYSSKPSKADCASDHSDPWDVIDSHVPYRDMTLDDETVPWQ